MLIACKLLDNLATTAPEDTCQRATAEDVDERRSVVPAATAELVGSEDESGGIVEGGVAVERDDVVEGDVIQGGGVVECGERVDVEGEVIQEGGERGGVVEGHVVVEGGAGDEGEAVGERAAVLGAHGLQEPASDDSVNFISAEDDFTTRKSGLLDAAAMRLVRVDAVRFDQDNREVDNRHVQDLLDCFYVSGCDYNDYPLICTCPTRRDFEQVMAGGDEGTYDHLLTVVVRL